VGPGGLIGEREERGSLNQSHSSLSNLYLHKGGVLFQRGNAHSEGVAQKKRLRRGASIYEPRSDGSHFTLIQKLDFTEGNKKPICKGGSPSRVH